MEVQMKHALRTVRAAVTYHAVAVAKSQCSGDFRYLFKYMRYVFYIRCVHTVNRGDMELRDNKHVNRCLRSYIIKSKTHIVLINLF